jgi:PAS domain S-box-containing protein
MKKIYFRTSIFAFLICFGAAYVSDLPGYSGSGIGEKEALEVFSDEFRQLRIDSRFEYYFDGSDTFDVGDVSATAFSDRFKKMDDSYPNLGYHDETLWLKLTLHNTTNAKRHPFRLLLFHYPMFHYLDYYQVNEAGKIVSQKQTGSLRPVSSRAYNDEKFVFTVSVPYQEEHTLFFRIKTSTTISVKASLLSLSVYFDQRFNRTLLSGIFIGFLLLVTCYFLFLYFQIQDKSFIYLSIGGIFLLISYFAITGIGYFRIWSAYPGLNLYLEAISITLAFMFYLMFSIEFLELKNLHANYPKIAYGFIFSLLSLIGMRFLISLTLYDRILFFMILISFTFIIYTSVKSYYNGFRPARIFSLGQCILGVFVLYAIFVEQGFVPGNRISESAINLGVLFALGFWAQGVSEKIGLIRYEKEKALRRLKKSEEQLSLVLQGANLGTWDWNLVNNKLEYNSIWHTMLGYEPHEFESPHHFWEANTHPDDRQGVTQLLEKHLSGVLKSYEVEYRMRHKNGGWLWMLDRGSIVEKDAHGNPIRIAGTHADITIRKNAEKKRREAEDALIKNEQNLRKLVQRLELIRAFHDTFADALELNVIYNRLYNVVPELMKDIGVNRVSLLLWDEESGMLLSDQYIGALHKAEPMISGPQSLDESISGTTL